MGTFERLRFRDIRVSTILSNAEVSPTWLSRFSSTFSNRMVARATEAIRFLRAASNKHGDATDQDARCTLDVQQITSTPDCPWHPMARFDEERFSLIQLWTHVKQHAMVKKSPVSSPHVQVGKIQLAPSPCPIGFIMSLPSKWIHGWRSSIFPSFP